MASAPAPRTNAASPRDRKTRGVYTNITPSAAISAAMPRRPSSAPSFATPLRADASVRSQR